jgi:RNA polymerase sigma-70 factor (ECF subfamily)
MAVWDERAAIRAAQEDPNAFGELYEHYVDRIYTYIYHRVGSVHDAEDLTSRTFFRRFHISPPMRTRAGLLFRPGSIGIAHNLMAIGPPRDRCPQAVIAPG